MATQSRWNAGYRTLIPVALAVVIGATIFVWLTRTAEPTTAVEGKTFHEVLRELKVSLVNDGVEACTEEEVLTADGYGEPHGLEPNAATPREVRALVERQGIPLDEHEQRYIGDNYILFVSRDRVDSHRFEGVEILAHIIELHWVVGGSKGVGRFEVVHAAAIIEC